MTAAVIVALMLRLRRLLTILIILGIALGSMVSTAWLGVTAEASGVLATAVAQDGRAGCEECSPGQGGITGVATAGCHGGLCLGLAGVLPGSPIIPMSAPARFNLAAASVPDGLSHPPGHRPPKAVNLLTSASPDLGSRPV